MGAGLNKPVDCEGYFKTPDNVETQCQSSPTYYRTYNITAMIMNKLVVQRMIKKIYQIKILK